MNTESITWWDLIDELTAMLWNPGRLMVTDSFHIIVTQATHDRLLGENRLVLRVGDNFDLHVYSHIDMTDDVVDLWIFKPRPVQIVLPHPILEKRRALYTYHFASGLGLTRGKLKSLSLNIRDMLRGLPDYPIYVENARRPRLKALMNRLLDSDGVLAHKTFAQRNAAFARIESSLLNEM